LDSLLAAGGLSGTVRLQPLLDNILGAGASRILEDGLPSWPSMDLLRDVVNTVEQAVAALVQTPIFGVDRNDKV
jgi:hypothetical protein